MGWDGFNWLVWGGWVGGWEEGEMGKGWVSDFLVGYKGRNGLSDSVDLLGGLMRSMTIERLEKLMIWGFYESTDLTIQRIDGLTDWRIDGLTSWRFADWRFDDLTIWMIDELTNWRVDELTCWRIDGLTDWRFYELTIWRFHELIIQRLNDLTIWWLNDSTTNIDNNIRLTAEKLVWKVIRSSINTYNQMRHVDDSAREKNDKIIPCAGKIWHLEFNIFYQNHLISNIYVITLKCSLKQNSLLHNDMSQSLHSYIVLEFRRRRCWVIKLLLENFCNDFITRLFLTFLHSICMHITQYLIWSNFCMFSCSQIDALLIKSTRLHDLIFDFESLNRVKRSKCSKRFVTRSCRNALWAKSLLNFAYDRFSIVLTILYVFVIVIFNNQYHNENQIFLWFLWIL